MDILWYTLRCQNSSLLFKLSFKIRVYYTVDTLVFFVCFIVEVRFNPHEELCVAVYSTLGHRFLRWTVKFICLDFASLLG